MMRINSGSTSNPCSAIIRIRSSDKVQSGWRVIRCSFLGRLGNAKDTPDPASSGDGLFPKVQNLCYTVQASVADILFFGHIRERAANQLHNQMTFVGFGVQRFGVIPIELLGGGRVVVAEGAAEAFGS